MVKCYKLPFSLNGSGDTYILTQTLESFDFLTDNETRLSDTVISVNEDQRQYTLYTLRKEIAAKARRSLEFVGGITPGKIKEEDLLEQRSKKHPPGWAWQIALS